MNRRALLIEAGKAKHQKAIAGPPQDVRRLRLWLTSNNGGAWEDSEIETLSNPTFAEVSAAVTRAGKGEYAFVSFSGHGWIEEDPRTGGRKQKVIVGSGESIDLASLRPGVKKCTLLCDACREVEQVMKFSEAVAKAMKYARDREQYTRASYRKWYDDAITAAADGAFFLYGCLPNECSYEDPMEGGYFTEAMIVSAARWCDNVTAHGCLLMPRALEMATPVVAHKAARFTPQQHPTGGPENRSRGNDFPFAVAFA